MKGRGCKVAIRALLVLVSLWFLLAVQVYALKESTGPGGSNAQAVHLLGQRGEGIKVGILGLNIYTEHEAFFDKDANGNPVGSSYAFNYDVTGDGIKLFDHDTWMAGIVASRGGKVYPNDIGVAPGCEVHCVRVIDDSNGVHLIDGLNKLIQDIGCDVILTGFAYSGEPNGEDTVARVYDYYADTHDVVFAHAAGNNGTGGLWIPADAYNGITTGGLIETAVGEYRQVGTVSGRGPTADGRNKPDVVAPSNAQHVPHKDGNVWTIPVWDTGQTSLAVPHTAGVAALLLGMAKESANGNDEHSEVIRAVIVNSSFPNIKDRSGNLTDPTEVVWQEDRGYGRVDALRAYQLLSAGEVTKGEVITQPKGWAYASIFFRNQEDIYYISGQKDYRLVLTVTWDRKILGPPLYNEDLPRFRLDLTVRELNGTELYVNNDPNNNLKKVDIVLPVTGVYTVSLKNPGINKSRDYAMAFELIPPVQADLNMDYGVDENDLGRINNSWLQDEPEIDEKLVEDGIINGRDFGVLANNWRKGNPIYYCQ